MFPLAGTRGVCFGHRKKLPFCDLPGSFTPTPHHGTPTIHKVFWNFHGLIRRKISRSNHQKAFFTDASWEHDSSFPTLPDFIPLPIAALAEERSCVFTAADTYRNCTCFANRVDLIALLCRFCFTSLPRCFPGGAITGRRGRTSRQPGQQKLRQLPKELPQPYFHVKDHRSPYLQTPVWFTSFKQFS